MQRELVIKVQLLLTHICNLDAFERPYRANGTELEVCHVEEHFRLTEALPVEEGHHEDLCSVDGAVFADVEFEFLPRDFLGVTHTRNRSK